MASVSRLVADEALGNWDETIEPSELGMEGGGLELRRLDRPALRLRATVWAENQLCAKLGIPAGYFRKCPPELKDAQFRYWMDRLVASPVGKAPKLFLRGNGATVRGILSERYARIDNVDLVRAAEPLEASGLDVAGFALTEASFHLRLVDPAPHAGAGSDDPLFAGVHVSNSEVGMKTLSVDALVYRQVCTNGLVRLVGNRSVYARRHVGRAPGSLADILAQSVRSALELAGRSALAFARSKETSVDDPEARIESLGRAWNLGEEVRYSIAAQLSAERHPGTAYGLINAITTVAGSRDPDERFRMESLAGSLLD